MGNGNLTPFRRGSLAGRGTGGGAGRFGGGVSLFDLHRQMNSLFDDLVSEPRGSQSFSAPALEVHQADDHLEITAELPGVKEEDIELMVEDGVLTLRGEKRSTRTNEEHGYSERQYGRFERSISLPSNIDEEKCSAEFRDGVLVITLPKAAERQRGKRIPLGGGAPQQLPQGQNDHTPPRQQAAQETGRKKDPQDGQQR